MPNSEDYIKLHPTNKHLEIAAVFACHSVTHTGFYSVSVSHITVAP